MHNSRIEITDTAISAITKLSGGNPGAVHVCCRLFKELPEIDPDAMLGGFAPLLSLDTLGIYGPRIWMLYKDVRRQDLVKVCAVLRANGTGILTERQINAAIDERAVIDLDDVLAKVRAWLPRFGAEASPDATGKAEAATP
jgi:hypothetical protein